MNERRYIIWLVMGLGGVSKLLSDWVTEFGPIPDDQAGEIEIICKDLRAAIELGGNPRQA